MTLAEIVQHGGRGKEFQLPNIINPESFGEQYAVARHISDMHEGAEVVASNAEYLVRQYVPGRYKRRDVPTNSRCETNKLTAVKKSYGMFYFR